MGVALHFAGSTILPILPTVWKLFLFGSFTPKTNPNSEPPREGKPSRGKFADQVDFFRISVFSLQVLLLRRNIWKYRHIDVFLDVGFALPSLPKEQQHDPPYS